MVTRPSRGGRSFKPSTTTLADQQKTATTELSATPLAVIKQNSSQDFESATTATLLKPSSSLSSTTPQLKVKFSENPPLKKISDQSDINSAASKLSGESPPKPSTPTASTREEDEIQHQSDINSAASKLSGESPPKPSTPTASTREEDEIQPVSVPKRPKPKIKTNTKSKPEEPPAALAPTPAADIDSDEEVSQYFKEKDAKKKKRKENARNSNSLSESKSLQRMAYQQRQSMDVNLQIPSQKTYPLLHAAATNDLQALNRFASTSSSNIAALTCDANGISALHYAAYFHSNAATKALLNLAMEPIKAGSKLELEELTQKRVRVMEETKYTYNNALNAIDDIGFDDFDQTASSKSKNTPEQMIEDAVTFENWCSNEIKRLLRVRELKCEEMHKKLLTFTDKTSRTPLHYAASTSNSDEVTKILLSTGRACLSASVPNWVNVDVKHFITDKLDLSKNKSKGKSKSKSKSRMISSFKPTPENSFMRFVSPPCNSTSTNFAVTYAENHGGYKGTSHDNSEINTNTLFPRDGLFHATSGQVKNTRRNKSKSSKSTSTSTSTFHKLPTKITLEEDQIKWWCGRLLSAVGKRRSQLITKFSR